MKCHTLTDLVDSLHRLDAGNIDLDRVGEILSSAVLEEASLRPYLRFSNRAYQRNLVHRSDLFDIMVLCWRPGQETPIHNHCGQLGWIRLVRGRIEETGFKHPGGGPTPDLTRIDIDIDDEGVGHGIELTPVSYAVAADPGTVSTVDRVRAIHKVSNPARHADDEPAVTLHVYSRPHDSCLVFDQDARTCQRRVLHFHNAPEVDLQP